jgi:hypothetical protein
MKNSINAIKDSLSQGFGLETDIRDCLNNLVISHDLPTTESIPLPLAEFSTLTEGQLIAWNIKADGLIPLILRDFNKDLIDHSVFFDMSIPETLNYKKKGLPYLVRLSEYETLNSLITDSKGVWIDSFHDQWYEINIVESLLKTSKIVILVSPELHGREHISLWQSLKNKGLHKNENFYLCTDYPILAEEYFDEQD